MLMAGIYGDKSKKAHGGLSHGVGIPTVPSRDTISFGAQVLDSLEDDHFF